MCVLYVSFWSNVRPRICRYVTIGSAVMFILRSIWLVFSVGSGVNRVQVVLSGFSVRVLCFGCTPYLWCYLMCVIPSLYSVLYL